MLLRIARSVGKGADIAGINVQELARTTEYAWAETTLDGKTPPNPDPSQDRIGNVPLITVAEVTDPEAIAVGSRALGGGGGALPSLLGAPAEDGATGEAGDALPDDAPPTGDAAAGDAAAGDAAAGDAAAGDAAADASAVAPDADVPRAAGGRVVVFGDSDFATNELLDQASNQDLFLNVLAWLAGEENQISIRPNEAAKGSLTLGLLEGLFLALVSLLVLPGLAVAGAVATWLRRRRL